MYNEQRINAIFEKKVKPTLEQSTDEKGFDLFFGDFKDDAGFCAHLQSHYGLSVKASEIRTVGEVAKDRYHGWVRIKDGGTFLYFSKD